MKRGTRRRGKSDGGRRERRGEGERTATKEKGRTST